MREKATDSLERLRWVYRKMIEIRLFEEAAIDTFRQKLWKGSLHQCIGQEAIDAVFGVALREKDFLLSSHRGHGHVLAKGVPPRSLMAELFGRQTGLCSGRGGSMHAIDPERRVYPQGLVGSGAYLAAGIGMAITMQKGSEVVGCAFGDGATNAGGCHEGMSIAAIHKAPVVFVCENNGMAVSTPIQGVLPVRRISDRAVAYGMPGRTVDGTDAVEVLQAMDEFVSRARNGDGPSFLEATCYRWHGHTVWDTSGYRTKEENEAWMTHDPIPKLAEYLKSHGALADTEDGSWKQEIRQVIEEAVQFAKTSPAPEGTREDIQRFVYVESQEAVG